MRALVITLLLLNVAFFGWAKWIDVPVAPVIHSSVDPKLPTLVLLPASGAAAGLSGSEASAGSGANPAVAGTAAARCRTLGPYMDAEIAKAAAEALQTRGLLAHQRKAKTITADGYWVYLSGVGSPAEQRRTLVRLKSHGIQDVALFADPDQSQRISVGVFSDQSRAVRRADQVKKLGFNPVVDLHQRVRDTLWLDVELGAAVRAVSQRHTRGRTVPRGRRRYGCRIHRLPGRRGRWLS